MHGFRRGRYVSDFGVDEPSACYHDLEITQNLVLWGNTPRKPTGALERIVAAKRSEPGYKIFNIQTHPTLSSRFADVDIIFKPNTDLAIANYILRESCTAAATTRTSSRALHLATGPYDIGYGMRPTEKFAYPAERDTQVSR